ncbi:hypothetical protein [Vibrio brasiliensis]
MNLIERLIIRQLANCLVIYQGGFHQPCRECCPARAVMNLIECLIIRQLANRLVIYQGGFHQPCRVCCPARAVAIKVKNTVLWH